jgi:hypothetical protein
MMMGSALPERLAMAIDDCKDDTEMTTTVLASIFLSDRC